MPKNFEILPRFTVLRDTYTVDAPLGEGAYGIVYRVRHKFLGIQALKAFDPEAMSLETSKDLFHEAVVLSRITHPNVVRIFEANFFTFRDRAIPYVAMEYVPSGSLAQILYARGNVSCCRALLYMIMICRGLCQAHQLNPPLIHRDIKPQNIMLDLGQEEAVLKVSDFGQAKHADPMTRLTDSAGTLAYMPPEGFWNYTSPASDVFSAGMVFYQMLTGVVPFQIPGDGRITDKRRAEIAIRQSRSVVPLKPSSLMAGIDGDIDRIVLKSLAQDPATRYPDARALLLDLEQYASLDHPAFIGRIEAVLNLGRQYRDLPDAISEMLAVQQALPASQREKFLARFGEVLNSWRKGIIL